MKSINYYAAGVILLVIMTIINLSASAEYYYCRSGQKPLTVCDSLIYIKFNPLVPHPTYELFAQSVAGLDENFTPYQAYRQFIVFHVDDGYSIDSLCGNLYERQEVLFAFPAYKDPGGVIYEPNDLFVISYMPGVPQPVMDSMANHYQLVQLEGPLEITGSRVMAVVGYTGLNILEIANRFYESGFVEYSQPAMFVPRIFSNPVNDPLYHYQYNLKNSGQTGGKPGIDIDVEKAWEITSGSYNTIIAVIDCGSIRLHEDLNSAKILWSQGRDYVGTEPIDSTYLDFDPSPGDSSAHGVACQGILTAVKDNGVGVAGIAPECSLVPLKIFDDGENGTGWPTVPEKAIRQALASSRYYKYARMVISCSWGYYPGMELDNISKIIDTAVFMDIPIVFASGNSGEWYGYGNSLAFPASLPTVISVGAVRKEGIRWAYSGSGPGLDVVAPSGYASRVAGDLYTLDQPGQLGYNPTYVSCAFTNEDYLCTFGGTSGAAPQVAGILALVLSRRPDIRSFYTLKKIIDSSAIDGIGGSDDSIGRDPGYGYGLASAFRALLAVSRGDPNNDHTINMSDVTYLINWLYKGGPAPVPDRLMGDAYCDGILNIHDIQYLINYLYKGGPAPIICFKY